MFLRLRKLVVEMRVYDPPVQDISHRDICVGQNLDALVRALGAALVPNLQQQVGSDFFCIENLELGVIGFVLKVELLGKLFFGVVQLLHLLFRSSIRTT
jgi:hypothetical protein